MWDKVGDLKRYLLIMIWWSKYEQSQEQRRKWKKAKEIGDVGESFQPIRNANIGGAKDKKFSFSSCRCLPFRLSKSSLHFPYHCTTVLLPHFCTPRFLQSPQCGKLLENFGDSSNLCTYDVAQVGAIPNLSQQLDLFSSSDMNDGNKNNWIY